MFKSVRTPPPPFLTAVLVALEEIKKDINLNWKFNYDFLLVFDTKYFKLLKLLIKILHW